MRRRGMTLLEVTIAIGLGLAMVAAVFTFLFDVSRSREHLLAVAEQRRAVALLFEGIERDLATALTGDRGAGSGVTGDETRLRILSRGVPIRLVQGGHRAGAPFADLEVSEYRFDETERVVEARRGLGLGTPGASAPYVLGADVAKVRFRYHDGSDWRDRFDSLASDRLPVAVEVAVWFELPEDPNAPPPDEMDEDIDWAPADLEDLESFEDDVGPLDDLDEPPPDRRRVIAVPGAALDDDGASDEGFAP